MRKWLAPIVAILTQAFAVRGAVGPFVFADELGYIAAARYFGPGEQDVQMLAAFYHFGYGLLLTPLTLLLDEPSAFYRAATILNAGLIVAATLVFDRLILRRYLEIPADVASLAAVGFAVAPSVLVNTSILWAETALVLMLTLTLASLLSLATTPTVSRAVLVGLVATGGYAMHPRALAMVLAAVGTVVVAALVGRIPRSLAAITMTSTVGGLLVVRSVNAAIKAALYTEGSFTQSAGGITRLIVDEPVQWLVGLVGTGWYQLLASAGLVGFAVFRWGRDAAEIRSGRLSIPAVGSLFLLATLGMSWLAGAVIAVGDDARIDHLIYGRYLDVVAPFALGFGIVELAGAKRPNRWWAGSVGVVVAVVGVALAVTRNSEVSGREVVRLNVPVASALQYLTDSWSPFSHGLVAGAVAIGVAFSVRWKPAMGVTMLVVASVVGAGTVLVNDVHPASRASGDIRELAEMTEELANNGTVFLTGPYEVWMLYGLQYWADDVQFELETHCPGASNELLVTLPDDPRYLEWAYRMSDPQGDRVFLSDPEKHASLSRSLTIVVESIEQSPDQIDPTRRPRYLVEMTVANTDPDRDLVIFDSQVLGLFARWYPLDANADLVGGSPTAVTTLDSDIHLTSGQATTVTLALDPPDLAAGRYEVRIEPRADGWVWLASTPCGRATAGRVNITLG